MQYQAYKATDNTTINCSNCHKPVDLGLIAEHVCVKSAPLTTSAGLPYPVPKIRTPPSPAGSFRGQPSRGPSLHQRPQRPVLPKIDSSFMWQNGELTPASSGHGSVLASPVSATSSRTSQSRSRKPTNIHRPPSPGLISQDCAFPPFPGMAAPKSKRSNNEHGLNPGKEQTKSKISASATSSARSSSSSPLSHSRTISSTSSGTTTTRRRSRSVFAEGSQHRPATAPEGHAPEFSSQLRNITVPPALPSVPPPLPRVHTAPTLPRTQTSEAPLMKMHTVENILDSKPNNGGTEEAEMSIFGVKPARKPTYKSWRPPPIATNLALPTSLQPSKSPVPPSARSLKRTLTEKLFGRKPSNGRRSMVREALSEEPEPMPVPPTPPMLALAAAGSPPSRPSRSPGPVEPRALLAKSESPILAVSPLITVSETMSLRELPASAPVATKVERQRHASFATLHGQLPTPEIVSIAQGNDINPSATSASEALGSADFDFGLEQTRTGARRVSHEPAGPSDKAKIENTVEAVRRSSIESASSYGSIGFTERTFSSRSSPPPTDEVARKGSDTIQRLAVEDGQYRTAPLRPRIIGRTPDSPTDPHCINGRLSPILPKDADASIGGASIDAQIVSPISAAAGERRTSSSSASASASSYSESDELDVVNLISGFQSREVSLARAPPPLFHKANLPPSTDTEVKHAEATVQPLPADRQQHTPRQDSLAGMGSGQSGIKGTCRGCSRPILVTQKSVSSADGRLSGKYHKDCFACYTCRAAFATAEFYVHDDQPYCAHHYHQLEDSLCATCGKGIEGLYMETANVAGRGKEKHHPTCLKCATCRILLTSDYFELSGKVYCEKDAFRLASAPRMHSRGPARPSPLVREYIRSGDPGALRGSDFPERRIGRPMLEAR